MKKILLVTSIAAGIILELSSFNVYANSENLKNIGYWQDVDGNYVATKLKRDDGSFLLKRDDWISGYESPDNNALKLRLHIKDSEYYGHYTGVYFYKNNDCSGSAYIEVVNLNKPGFVTAISESDTDIVGYKVNYGQPKEYDVVEYNDDNERSLTFNSIQVFEDGQLMCKLPDEYEFHDGQTIKLGKVESIINLNEKYSWIAFELMFPDSSYFKGIFGNAHYPMKFISTEPDPDPDPDKIEIPDITKDISVKISADGKLTSAVKFSYDNSKIYIDEIKVYKVDQGVYEIKLPDRYLPSQKENKDLQLTCSSNRPSLNDGGKMGISCYKLNNKSVIRVVSNWEITYPSNTTFTLRMRW
ncbi:hypothetical protein C0W54_05875 [Photobacterium kishitanii]|uniref:hypothetical protein n=1 Tax=Photobacterium kishitanii TaxID=318456 RepID=UPI000D15E322|nr:hypothetical protein [Photobacterium kishitanii]PSW62363.1 hypothetical protein C0W54_05875 [Photobacterium kishitanii]